MQELASALRCQAASLTHLHLQACHALCNDDVSRLVLPLYCLSHLRLVGLPGVTPALACRLLPAGGRAGQQQMGGTAGRSAAASAAGAGGPARGAVKGREGLGLGKAASGAEGAPGTGVKGGAGCVSLSCLVLDSCGGMPEGEEVVFTAAQ